MKPKRSRFLLVALLPLCCACGNNAPTTKESPEKPAAIGAELKIPSGDPHLEHWIAYYKRKDNHFDLSHFHLKDTAQLEITPGTVTGTFDPKFDQVYRPFLVDSPDKTKYIDFDSYQWHMSKDEAEYSPDQEIDLVDIHAKTVQRIAFRGVEQWVENAAWNGNSIVYLLENSSDRQPSVSEINLKTGKVRIYVYDGKLSFKSNYADVRMQELFPKD